MDYKLVIFDADGTLTPQRDGSCGPFEQRLLPGVAEKCAELRAGGAVFGIASNQSTRRPAEEVNAQLEWTAEQIGVAPEMAWCAMGMCRKPDPGVLLEIMRLANIAPERTLFVGDQDTDRQAAENAGCDFAWSGEYFSR